MAKGKILVIDDEQDVTLYLSTLFEDNDYDVIEAKNGKEGYDKAISEKPDLITLDITMPEQSGVRCYRDLQENDATKHIPVIIVTGVTMEFKRFIESRKQIDPPTYYFEKPIDRKALIEKVDEILKK